MYQKTKHKNLLSIEKTCYNYKELFSLKKSTVILKSNDGECIKAKNPNIFWNRIFEVINVNRNSKKLWKLVK